MALHVGTNIYLISIVEQKKGGICKILHFCERSRFSVGLQGAKRALACLKSSYVVLFLLVGLSRKKRWHYSELENCGATVQAVDAIEVATDARLKSSEVGMTSWCYVLHAKSSHFAVNRSLLVELAVSLCVLLYIYFVVLVLAIAPHKLEVHFEYMHV